MLKKAIAVLLISTFLVFSLGTGVWASSLNIKGESCILVDGVSGQVLYEETPDKKWFPASTTKIMTMVLALEAVAEGKISLEDQVNTSEYAAGMGGSQVYLYPGETRTLHEMLIAVAVGSGNDASVAIAEYVAGSNEAFVEMMNNKAREIGMKNTKFTNAHGLHDNNHYTTAEDLAKLAVYALRVPKMLEYTSIYEYDFRPEPKPLKLWNTNRLLKWYQGTDGLKTGTTSEAKRNLVCTAERNGLRLVSVVMGVDAAKGHFTETMKLMNYGFNQYEFSSLYSSREKITSVRVGKGAVDTVDAVTGDKVGMTQKKGEKLKLETRINVSKYVDAPVKKGVKLGEVIVLKDGQEIDRVDLLAGQEVTRGGWIRQFSKMLKETLFVIN